MQVVFDLHLGSIKSFNIATTFTQEFKVHYLTQRYAQLTSSLLLLNADYSVLFSLCSCVICRSHVLQQYHV